MVFLFLLNASGAIILFVYLLICVSQVILRRRTPADKLRVKMWLFPGLSMLAILGIVAVLVQMGLTKSTRSQLVLSLIAWAAVLAFSFITKWRGGSVDAETGAQPAPSGTARRVLVLANETVAAGELIDELHRIDRATTGRCTPWPRPTRGSSRARSSSVPTRSTGPPGCGSMSSTGRERRPTCR